MRRMRSLAICVVLATVAACDPAEEQPVVREDVPGVEDQDDLVTPARYRTSYTFVGFEGTSALHLRLLNRTTADAVIRDYRGWLGEGDQWRPILSEQDTLAAPRMAWRVTPVGPFRLAIGEGGEIEALRLVTGASTIRLTAAESSGEWLDTGVQGESIRFAQLARDSVVTSGLLLTLRSARRTESEVPALITQVIFAADTLGNGILVARTPSAPDEPATAWTYFDGVEADWTDGEVHTLSEPEGAVGRWSLQLPEANIAGEFSGSSVAVNDLTENDGARVLRIEGFLLLGEETRRVTGISIETPTP